MRRGNRLRCLNTLGAVVIVLAATALARAQEPAADGSAQTAQVVRQLSEQVAELQAAIQELRAESMRYRAETEQLRRELQSVAAQVRVATPAAEGAALSAAALPSPGSEEQRLAKLQEQYDLLRGKVDDQYQTKVESASKYRVRLSGIVLLNLFSNFGAVDNQDTPTVALPQYGNVAGSFGGTLRQSQLGLEVFGPEWHGARIRGNIQMDFGGGFPNTDNGVTMGIMRLRTGIVRMDWPNTSVVAGQDVPFFSPLSPTSIAQLATPALAYAGNLWTWMPQLRIEHRFLAGGKSMFTVQGGILDPLTGERPASQYLRVPQAGEASRQPAYATRFAWSSSDQERAASIGIGAYYSRQNWGYERSVDSWAATADWSVPLGHIFTVSGEFYRGRGIGGLGGALGNSVVYQGAASNPATPVLGLDAVGGWAQVNARISPTIELNVAAGQDNPFASQLRFGGYATAANYAGTLRNRSAFTNVIYRPRSDLLFSLEYRRLQSFTLNSSSRSADQVNLMMGVLF